MLFRYHGTAQRPNANNNRESAHHAAATLVPPPVAARGGGVIHLHYSNRMERLAEALAQLLAAPPADPLAPEVVLVQSQGMARWLALQLAQHHRICANVQFHFPATYAWQLLRAFKPELGRVSDFEPEVLSWRIYGLLPELLDDPRYAELASYLRGGSPADRFELARRIADVYDQYLVYRPDWILAWQAGEAEHWQATLWRRLCQNGAPHRAQLLQELISQLREQAPPARLLPERVAVFGLASLPEPYVALLDALGRHCQVHVFLLNPSAEYWGEIRSEREIRRRAGNVDPELLHLETGNRLLASWGRQGRDFLELLLDYPTQEHDYMEPVPGERLLHALQRDILHLQNRDGEPAVLAPDDISVQVHSCHSRLREVEVLHDQLLRQFAEDPSLSPDDVVVMTPDIDAYAPYIDAVFATAEGPRIPFAIADRSPRRERPVIDCFLKLLELGEGRLQADQVGALLETAALRERFGIAESELPTLYDWIHRTGIRWGRDAEHRQRLGLPAVAEHSWQAGLDRILLGYAMPGRELQLFQGILPFDAAEGGRAELAGKLLAFVEAVFLSAEELAGSRTLSEWHVLLNGLLERFFRPEPEVEEALQAVREALEELREAGELAQLAEPVPLDVIAGELQRRLEAQRGVSGFLGGGVTFCAMVPMRSIPFRVVCLLGLNDGEFPRQQRPLGFDLMASQPRRGDRVRRFEDRYLFLEALLSARDCLYLSYVGQDLRDNSVLPPSPIIDELLDYIERGWRSAGGGPVREQLLTRHRLQAFSPAYFDGRSPRLFSFAAHLCTAGELAGRGRQRPQPLLRQPLPEPEQDWRCVELAQLIEFWLCPAEFLLKHRLGLRLEERGVLLSGREPFVLDGLERWQLRQDLLQLQLRGKQEGAAEYARAAGRLPHGAVGMLELAESSGQVGAFVAQLQALPAVEPEPRPFVLELGDFRLSGQLDKLSAIGRIEYRLGRSRSQDLLRVWIAHLALNVVAPAGVMPASHWLSEAGWQRFKPLEEARELLERLLHWYGEGQRRLLPFLPKASQAWAEQMRRSGDRQVAQAAAARCWRGNDHQAGEQEQPYLALGFAGVDPTADPLFKELAEAVWLPLLSALEEQS